MAGIRTVPKTPLWSLRLAMRIPFTPLPPVPDNHKGHREGSAEHPSRGSSTIYEKSYCNRRSFCPLLGSNGPRTTPVRIVEAEISSLATADCVSIARDSPFRAWHESADTDRESFSSLHEWCCYPQLKYSLLSVYVAEIRTALGSRDADNN